jgi:hypothetical protein
MHLFLGVGVEAAPHFPLSFTLVYVVGFIAAVTIGSILISYPRWKKKIILVSKNPNQNWTSWVQDHSNAFLPLLLLQRQSFL